MDDEGLASDFGFDSAAGLLCDFSDFSRGFSEDVAAPALLFVRLSVA